MKYTTVVLIILMAGLVSSFHPMDNTGADTSEKGFALIELFTSQGCSSCPAADRLLSELIREEGDNVYGLSFHVSYWNYLGWKDPYSSDSHTERQREYARVFNNNRIYTPQMVVNGQEEFVGSGKALAENAIKKALGNVHQHTVDLKMERINDRLRLGYTIRGPLKERLLNIAIVEKDITTKVTRGENRSRTLHHDNVVRLFKTTAAKTAGELTLPVPEGLDPSNGAVIVYIQHEKTWEITGASRILLKKGG